MTELHIVIIIKKSSAKSAPTIYFSMLLVAITIRKEIRQKEKMWKVIQYTKSNITCGNILNKWFSNIGEHIINASITITTYPSW